MDVTQAFIGCLELNITQLPGIVCSSLQSTPSKPDQQLLISELATVQQRLAVSPDDPTALASLKQISTLLSSFQGPGVDIWQMATAITDKSNNVRLEKEVKSLLGDSRSAFIQPLSVESGHEGKVRRALRNAITARNGIQAPLEGSTIEVDLQQLSMKQFMNFCTSPSDFDRSNTAAVNAMTGIAGEMATRWKICLKMLDATTNLHVLLEKLSYTWEEVSKEYCTL